MYKYSLDNKRYTTLNYFYKTKFNKKVFKVSLNAGFSCPNKVNGSNGFVQNLEVVILLEILSTI